MLNSSKSAGICGVFLILILVSLLLVAGCSDDSPVNGTGKDKTPPARITDLAVTDTSSGSVTLRWTATGDDGSVGTASEYDIRYYGKGRMAATTGSRMHSAHNHISVGNRIDGRRYYHGNQGG